MVWFDGLTGDPSVKVCTAYQEYYGSDVGRMAFGAPLQKIHGGSLNKQEELQGAWNKSYVGLFLDSESSNKWKDNTYSQLGTSLLSFGSGFGLLKYFYPQHAASLWSALLSIGATLYAWRTESRGAAMAILGSGALAFAWLFPPAAVALAPIGAGMQKFGANHAGYNSAGQMFQAAATRAPLAVPQAQQMVPQYQAVKKPKASSGSSESGSSD